MVGSDQDVVARRAVAPLFERMAHPDQRKNLSPVLRDPLIARPLNLLARNVFQPGQHLQGNGHPRSTPPREQHQFLFRARLRGLTLFLPQLLMALDQQAGSLR